MEEDMLPLRPVIHEHEEIRRKLNSAACELAYIENVLWLKAQMGNRLTEFEVIQRVKLARYELRRQLHEALALVRMIEEDEEGETDAEDGVHLP